MLANAMREHLRPWLAFVVSVAKTEHDEREPTEEEQSIEQRTAGKTARYAEQRTIGSNGSEDNGKEDDGIDGCVTPKAWVTKGLPER